MDLNEVRYVPTQDGTQPTRADINTSPISAQTNEF